MSNKTAAKRQPVKIDTASQQDTNEYIDTGTLESGIFQANDEVCNEFSEAQRIARGGKELIRRKYIEASSDERLVGGEDPDVNWLEASTSGEESVSGANPPPDLADVDLLGQAVGLAYEDNEPLHTPDKIAERDRHRWELDPASSEDYKARLMKRHQE